eukprot:GHVU01007790.1.p1 GENE.GHVU01007790.1~~GHVU01007790.1.p1  ORF type:complete len:278 (+),score=45.77 GHVU01007790.1:268-1101(+)
MWQRRRNEDSSSCSQWQRILLYTFSVSATVGGAYALWRWLAGPRGLGSAAVSQISFSDFRQLLETRRLSRVVFRGDSLFLTDTDLRKYVTGIVPGCQSWLFDALQRSPRSGGCPEIMALPQTSSSSYREGLSTTDLLLLSSLGGVLGVSCMLLQNLFYGGDEGAAWGGPPERVGDAAAKTIITFDHVAGHSAVKRELMQLADILARPEWYRRLGVRVPRGVLLEGPSGTGKTLLARALAGSSGLPFIEAPASSFVELFVGQGAARVRKVGGDYGMSE